MDLDEIITKYQTAYTNLLDSISVIDEADPMTPQKIQDLRLLLEDFNQLLVTQKQQEQKIFDTYTESSKQANNHYNQEILEYKNHINQAIKTITNDHTEAKNTLQKQIETAKRETEISIKQLNLDVEFFIMTSEQNQMILQEDYEEAKKRYDYQISEAKNSYLAVVKKNNILLEDLRNKLSFNYQEGLASFDSDNKNIIITLNSLIEAKTKELKSLQTILEEERNSMKEKFRKESALLNENIKKAADEKNRVIDKAKVQYTKAQSDASIERENKRQEAQAQSQTLLKEFVTKISAIDEVSSKLKKEYELKTENIKREYYHASYKRTRAFHEQIERILNSSIKINNSYDKYTLHLIKYKNKQHMLDEAIEKKNTELLLSNLAKDYTSKILANRHNKNLLEIDKNFAIKNLNDKEQFDNKYYQEKNNIFENDYNYIVKTTNFRFAQKANLLRSQSQVRSKLLERNFDGIEANYYKKIETIQNKILAFKLEISLAEDLKTSLHEYHNKKYWNELHLEEVLNTLEIEKNKLLKEFNQYSYHYQIKTIQLAKDYGFKKIETENEKVSYLKDLKCSLRNYYLDKKATSSLFAIKKEDINERYEKINLQVTNNHNVKKAKNAYFETLYQIDNDLLSDITQWSTKLLDGIHRQLKEIIRRILTDVTPSEYNIHYLVSIINSFLKIFVDIYLSTMSLLENKILFVTDQRLKFIEEFKYKNSYIQLKNDYLQEQISIKENKNQLLDQIDSAEKTIENFKQKIFTIINDNEMISTSTRDKKRKKLDAKSIESIKENNLKIREYRDKIDVFSKMIRMNYDDLSECNKNLRNSDYVYSSELKKIKAMQRMDSISYLTFKENTQSLFASLQSTIVKLLEKNLLKIEDETQLSKNLKNQQFHLYKNILTTKNHLKNLIDRFINKKEIEVEKKKEKIKRDYTKDLRTVQRKCNKAYLAHQKEYSVTLEAHNKKVLAQQISLRKKELYYQTLLAREKKNYEAECENLNKLYEGAKDQFFSSCYALEDNIKNIKNFHLQTSKNNESWFKENKENCIKAVSKAKDTANLKLIQFIKTKNEEIQHLPVAYKYHSRLLNAETKKKNIELHEDIKEAKISFNLERKRVEKELSRLKMQLLQDKATNDLKQQNSIRIEKKTDKINTYQSLNNIKVSL